MSRYSVELTTDAEDSLAQIWLDAADRQAVTDAETTIHQLLSADPITNGYLVAEDLYRIAHAPLVAYYSINHTRMLVEIHKLWRPSR